MIEADKLVAAQLTEPRSTTPIKIPTTVVATIERITPPRIPLTIKKIEIQNVYGEADYHIRQRTGLICQH